MKLFRLSAIVLLSTFSIAIVTAHERWGDGTAVPAWIKVSCCGVSDVHRLSLTQLRRVKGGWYAEGYPRFLPDYQAMISQDEYVWLFYQTLPDGSESGVICFFVPQASV